MDPARLVLSAIVPNRKDLLAHALQHLEPEHFREETVRIVFSLLSRYYDVAADVMPLKFLSDLLAKRGVDAAKQLLYEELYAELEKTGVADHEYRYSVDALKEDRARQLTGEAITTSFEILERGATIGREDLRGHGEARQYLYGELARIDKLNHAEAAPEGFLSAERDRMLEDYANRKAGKDQGQGIKSGIGIIDRATDGFQNGEMILLCAYTGEGKSMLATQIAWHAAYEQAKNVFFATSETVRAQVMRRMYARHSRQPQFNFPEGLNTTKIKNGTLSDQEEEIYRSVLNDVHSNPSHGKMYVAQVPRGATLGFVESRLNRQAQQWDIDLVVVDYLALIKPDQKRQVQREEFNDILKDAKVMSTSHAEGRGVPLISPWAMSQTAYKEALRTGFYTLANLAETSEAEKSSDQIWSLLRFPEQKGEAKMQCLKMRDGDPPAPFTVETGYHCAYLGEKDGSPAELLSAGLGFTDSPFGML